MPAYNASPGQKVRVHLEGFVVYNTGGFIGVANHPMKGEPGATFDRDKGEFYFDIPEEMISKVKEISPYEKGALYLVTDGPTGRQEVVRADAKGRLVTLSGKDQIIPGPGDKVSRLYTEDEI